MVRSSNGSNQYLPAEEESESDRTTVHFTTIPTYVQRASLSQELEDALRRPLGVAGLAHGVTVFGLSGMGKTQLVLQYIETHKTLYESVLWLDVHSQETTRSSFERCCRKLGLPIGRRAETQQLQDSVSVRTILRWLSCRKEGQEWLVVIDNANDLTWNLHSIIPKGRIGTAIVTSHDRHAATLLDGKSEIINVDAMTNDESVLLLLNAIDCRYEITGDDTRALLETTVESLDKLPLAIDLAGRRMRTVARSRGGSGRSAAEENLKSILREYLRDLRLHRSELLRDTEFIWATSYQKTVWTAWETSLNSLQRFKQYHPEKLLSLMTQMNGTCIPTALFRHASSEFVTVCDQLGLKEAPSWLKEMLKLQDDGNWDDFVYRGAVDALQRFGLVRTVHEPDPGVMMHALVRWRAAEETISSEEWTLFLVFIVAVCHNSLGLKWYERHILSILPTVKLLTGKETCFPAAALAWTWEVIASVLQQGNRFDDCRHLREAISSLQESSLVPRHPRTPLRSAKLPGSQLPQTLGYNDRLTVTHDADGGFPSRRSDPPNIEDMRRRKQPFEPLKQTSERVMADSLKGYGSPSTASRRGTNPSRNGNQCVSASGSGLGGLEGRSREIPPSRSSLGPEVTTNSNNIDFMRGDRTFREIRRVVQQHPEMLEPILNEMAANNPPLTQLVIQNSEQFMQFLSEDSDENVTLSPGPQQISVTQEERAAIERVGHAAFSTLHQNLTNDHQLCRLGFHRDLVIEAYFLCDKNERLAAISLQRQ
jgi:hypothetical protein